MRSLSVCLSLSLSLSLTQTHTHTHTHAGTHRERERERERQRERERRTQSERETWRERIVAQNMKVHRILINDLCFFSLTSEKNPDVWLCWNYIVCILLRAFCAGSLKLYTLKTKSLRPDIYLFIYLFICIYWDGWTIIVWKKWSKWSLCNVQTNY